MTSMLDIRHGPLHSWARAVRFVLRRTLRLRYAGDLRSLSFLMLALGMIGAPFVLELSALQTGLWLVFSTLLCFSVSVINHNHCHRPMFRARRLNRIVDLLFCLARGHTTTTVIVPHNLNHHQHVGGTSDWIRPQLAGSGPGLLRLLRFILRASFTMARERRQAWAPRLSAARQRDLRIETAVLFMGLVTMLAIDWRTTLVFAVVPWLGALTMLVAINLLQHDGCDPRARYAHSRNFVGSLGNWFCFNNGFHSMHHLDPGMHWSRLARAHRRRVAPYLPPSLRYRSILGFLLRHYVFSHSRALPPVATDATPVGLRRNG